MVIISYIPYYSDTYTLDYIFFYTLYYTYFHILTIQNEGILPIRGRLPGTISFISTRSKAISKTDFPPTSTMSNSLNISKKTVSLRTLRVL